MLWILDGIAGQIPVFRIYQFGNDFLILINMVFLFSPEG